MLRLPPTVEARRNIEDFLDHKGGTFFGVPHGRDLSPASATSHGCGAFAHTGFVRLSVRAVLCGGSRSLGRDEFSSGS